MPPHRSITSSVGGLECSAKDVREINFNSD